MRGYLHSNHINSHQCTSSRVHNVKMGEQKREKTKAGSPGDPWSDIRRQKSNPDAKPSPKKPWTPQALEESGDTNWRTPRRSIPVNQYQPLFSLSVWSINHPMRGSRQSTIDPRRHLCGFWFVKMKSRTFLSFVPTIQVKLFSEHDLFGTSDNSPWNGDLFLRFGVYRVDPLGLFFFCFFFFYHTREAWFTLYMSLDSTPGLSFPLLWDWMVLHFCYFATNYSVSVRSESPRSPTTKVVWM